MRTSLEFPDPLFRHLKTRAAQDGTRFRELVLTLIERGLTSELPAAKRSATGLPSVSLGAPMALAAQELSNARLSEVLAQEP